MDAQTLIGALIAYVVMAVVVWFGWRAGIEGPLTNEERVKLILIALVNPLFLFVLILL